MTRRPEHGLDIAPVESYVAALEDKRYPIAAFQWAGMSEAAITADLSPGQVVAVQVTYEPGWEAWSNGHRQAIRGDAIGLTVIDTDCSGPCQISLKYTGGPERTITRTLSLLAALISAFLCTRLRLNNRPKRRVE